MNKYRAKKSELGGALFDSRAEARRYGELFILQRAGCISNLGYHTVFVLAPKVKIDGEARTRPAIRYIADFTYTENGRTVVEDVKSPATAKLPAFRMKQHLMKTVHNIDVRVVK